MGGGGGNRGCSRRNPEAGAGKLRRGGSVRRRRYPGGRVGLEAGSGVEGAPGMGVFLGGCEARRYPSPGGAGRGNRRPGRGEHRLSGCRDGGSPGGGSPTPGYPKPRVPPAPGSAAPGVSPSPGSSIPGLFPCLQYPHPRAIAIPRVPPRSGYPPPRFISIPRHPPPPGSCAPSRWLGWGRASRQQNGWELPGILHEALPVPG